MLKNRAVGASVTALLLGSFVFGAGLANAQPAEAGSSLTGSLSSSALDLDTEEMNAKLDLAIAALEGPVAVESRKDAGPRVSFTNRASGDAAATMVCAGFTMPYSTVENLGLNPNSLDPQSGNLKLVDSIEKGGKVSLLKVDETGAPVTVDSKPNKYGAGGISGLVQSLDNNGDGLKIKPGDTVTWEATAPTDEPAAAVVLCLPDDGQDREQGMTAAFGIDKQIIVNELAEKLPAGSSSLISTGSISPGTLELFKSGLGSIGEKSDGNTGETNNATE